MTDSEFKLVIPKGQEIEDAITAADRYLVSRANFIECADQSALLYGNDNLVGRIAEFFAIHYFLSKDYLVSRPKSKSYKGIDLKVKKGKKELLVSVKCITSENKKVTTSEVTEPEGGFNDSFLVVVVLISKTREHAVIEVEGHDWSKDRRKKKTVNRKVCPQLSEHIYSIEGLKPILGY